MSARGAMAAIFISVLVAASNNDAYAADESSSKEAKKEAQALFSKALKQADSGDQQGALTSFRAAYEKSPSFRVLYNIGQLCVRVADSACAVRSYEQYLRDGGTDVPAKRRTEVEQELTTLKRSLAMVTINVSLAGADVSVDDAAVGQSPLPAAVPLNAGDHHIVAKRADKSIDRRVTVAVGDAIAIDLQIPKDDPVAAPAPPPPPPAAPSPAAAPEKPAHAPIPIVPWAVTGAFAVGTVISGILASGAYSDFKTKRDAFPITAQDLSDAQGKARSLFLVTMVLGGVTVASAGVASYFTFVAPGSSAPPNARVGMAFGPGSVVVHGVMP